MAGKVDIQQFLQNPQAVAARVPASDLFSLLVRSFDLPARWSAMVTRDTGDHIVVKPGAKFSGDGAEEVLFVRSEPLELGFVEDGLIAADRFQCLADVNVRLVILTEPGELLSFSKALVGRRSAVFADDVARRLQPALRRSLARSVDNHEADVLVDGEATTAIVGGLAGALDAVCFQAGMQLVGDPTVALVSDDLRGARTREADVARAQREHQAAGELREALRAAQSEQLQHLTGVLGKLKDLAADSPDVELPQLIRSFPQEQRGQFYEALIASTPAKRKTQWVVVAAGDELLFFAPDKLDKPARRVPISGRPGAVRSVQAATDDDGYQYLLLGAATGVYRIPVGKSAADVTCVVPGAPAVRGGFNSAVMAGGRVFASHSELGIYCWEMTKPDQPEKLLEPVTREAKTIRGIAHFDGDVYCAIGDRIVRFGVDGPADRPDALYTGSRSTITAIRPTQRGLFAGNSQGDVLHWEKPDPARPELLHSSKERAVESIWLLSSCGIDRLIFSNTSVCVFARVLGDNFTGRYEAGGQTLMRAEAADDLLVAMSEVGDRLICWSSGNPQRPIATIIIAQMAGHMRDVCLLTA